MGEYAVVGKSVPRIDAPTKALGEAKFTADLGLPGMLYGKILRSPHAHARILNIDTSKAERLPGVKAVVTGKDALPYKWGVFAYTRDQQLLPIDKVRFIGEEVAAVAAVDEDIAREALELIDVEYEVLPAIFDPVSATQDGAPQLHDEFPGNLSVRISVNEGDVDRGFRESYHVREDTFSCVEENYCQLEPYAVLANYDSTGVDIWCPNAGPHMKSRPLSTALGIPTSDVRVRKVFIGGHFGGRSEVSPADYITALLSKKARRPVKVVYTREETFNCVRQVHASTLTVKTGVAKDGAIVAVDMKIILDGGAYASTGPIATSVGYQAWEETYRMPNLRYEGRKIYTNKPPRGMHPHVSSCVFIGLEGQLDMIAEDIGMDPMELRLRNAIFEGYVTPTQTVITSCGHTETIEKAAERAGWKEKRGKLPPGHGIGMASASVMSGFPMGIRGGSAAFVKFNEDGDVTVISGVVDNGQGNDSMLTQIAAEELGLPMNMIRVVSADTSVTPSDQGAYSQSSTLLGGGAVKEAAADAKKQLFEVAADMLEASKEDLESREGRIYVRGTPDKNISIGRAVRTALSKNKTIMGKGYRWPSVDPKREWVKNPRGQLGSAFSFGAAVAEVEVDLETGRVKLLNMVAAHDCGYPINPQAVEQQIERSAVESGVKGAILERHLWDNGQTLNSNFLDYWMPTTLDVPHIDPIIVITNDAFGPFGAKEGGMSLAMSACGAVANAIYNATGLWIKELPLTPDKILKALEEKRATES